MKAKGLPHYNASGLLVNVGTLRSQKNEYFKRTVTDV